MSRRYRSVHRLAALAAAVLLVATAAAATIDVPADYPTVQQALNVAMPGDTINVTGTYYEKIRFPRSGSAAGGYITLQAAPGATAVLAGTGVSGCDMVRITSQSYIRIIGFVIWDHTGVSDCSGVRMTGHGSHVEIRNNEIYKIRGTDAMGITIYGTDPQPISDLIIDGNFIHDCEPSPSEALTLNGNVTGFEVTNNFVRDVNNIGIDFIGGETSINPDPALVARNGLCRGNTVTRANSNYGGGFAGSIYVDGGKDIVIERNVVSLGDIGIEVGAENAGIVTSGVVVRDNFVFGSGKCGIAFGGYDATAGRADDNFFLGNTLYGNDTTGQGLGELFIQYGQNNTVRGNVFYSNAQNVLLYSELGNVNNALDWNGWYCPGGASAATFTWRSTPYTGFAAYQAGSGQDGSSLFADPALVAPAAGNLHLQAASPCLDRGDPAFVPGSGETDVDGQPRVANGRVDLGADEVLPGGQSPEDILTGQGPAPPNPNEVKVFAAAGQVVDFFAYAAGGFGTNVAAGNVDVDATSEIVTGPGPGPVFGPQARGFDRDGTPVGKINFYAYGTLKYGVNVATARLDADAFSEILTGAGPGAVFGPHVRGWNYDGATVTAVAKLSYFAYGTLRYGVNAHGGDVDVDAFDEILTGPGPGVVFGPQVRGFNYDGIAVTAMTKINFNAFTTTSYGASTSPGDVDTDGFAEIVCAPGPGPLNPAQFKGYDYDATLIAPVPGYDVTPFTTLFGGHVGQGDVAAVGSDALLASEGSDLTAIGSIVTFAYAGGVLTQVGPSFAPFAGTFFGVTVAGADLGY